MTQSITVANTVANTVAVINKQPLNSINIPPSIRTETWVNIAQYMHCCYCYNKASTDARCCGACYCCCPSKKRKEELCYFCPYTFSEYWYSGYVQTIDGPHDKEPNGFCCWLCFIPKFGLFFPCFLGSLFNSCINCSRDTDVNYLF